MGSPIRSCVQCAWYIRGKSFDGPPSYGGCFKKKQAVHANQTACRDDFDKGSPCLTLREAEMKARVVSAVMKLDELVVVLGWEPKDLWGVEHVGKVKDEAEALQALRMALTGEKKDE